MREIAEELGIAKSTLYDYLHAPVSLSVPGKRDLVRAHPITGLAAPNGGKREAVVDDNWGRRDYAASTERRSLSKHSFVG